MNNERKNFPKISDWLKHINETVHVTEGRWSCYDEKNFPIVIEWAKADILSEKLAKFKECVCEMASEIIAPVETEFLRCYPDAASQELFLKPCIQYFENQNGVIDWLAVENTIKETVQQFYKTDMSKFGMEMIRPLLSDVYFLVKATEENNNKPIGYLMCAVTPALPYGNVKVIHVGVEPAMNHRGVEKLLLGSLFKIIPEIKRLFMFTRPTNDKDLKTYRSLGFSIDDNPVQDPWHKINTDYSVPLEYKTCASGTFLFS